MQGTRSPRILIHQAPRRWPHVPTEPITIQAIQPPPKTSNTTILVTVASMVGLVVAALVYSQSGGASAVLGLGFLAVSGFSMIASLIAFIVQRQSANADARELARRYAAYLDAQEAFIKPVTTQEHNARLANDLSVLEMLNVLAHHPERAWQRQPHDPDFLAVRVGLGDVSPWLRVELADHAAPFAPLAQNSSIRDLQRRARQLTEDYQLTHDVPITVALREHAGIALINGESDTAQASNLARAIVAQVALHHAPNDVQIIIFAPDQMKDQWAWIADMPAGGQEWQGSTSTLDEPQFLLTRLLGELNRRQQMQRRRDSQQHDVPLPHLLIVVDSFENSGESDPLITPALALALQHGVSLGATILSVHRRRQQAPGQVTLAVEVAHRAITPYGANPHPITMCASIDSIDAHQGQAVATALKPFELEARTTLELPTSVLLLPLLNTRIHPDSYPIREFWDMTLAKQSQLPEGKRSLSIPLGRTIGQESLTLDFQEDGPHGLLIGQTGSGKSELLQSIIAALAINYPPNVVNFVLVDYKGGLAFDIFADLPHTVAYLTNMVSPSQTNRFLDMLDYEITQRQKARANKQSMPEMFVIIDEFAEMVSRRSAGDTNDIILDKLLSIARLGRELGVHLLFAAQRPEGNVIQRLRGYVQYRICLRTNTPEDSREVIYVPDAAQLPVEAPGRGYLLRGDNTLSLFQSARIHVDSLQSTGLIRRSNDGGSLMPSDSQKKVDAIIATRMAQLKGISIASRWPAPLPTPDLWQPAPLALFGGPSPQPEEVYWMTGKQPTLRPMQIPLGMFDRPIEQRREWLIPDLAGVGMQGGPLLVMGDPNSGKTTTLQTLLLFLAHSYSPSDIHWFILHPKRSLANFAQLPHGRDITNPAILNVIDGLDESEFQEFSIRFDRAVQMEAKTRQAVLLVIDDYDELVTTYKQRLSDLAIRAVRGRPQSVYLAISASRPAYDGLSPMLMNQMATKVLLYMNDRDQVRNIIRTPRVMDPIPGRGVVQTRWSLDEVQTAVPVVGGSEAERSILLENVISQLVERWR